MVIGLYKKKCDKFNLATDSINNTSPYFSVILISGLLYVMNVTMFLVIAEWGRFR